MAVSEWDHRQETELLAPPANSLAAVLAMGLFALSLAGVGVIFHLIFGRRGKGEQSK